MDKIPEPVWVFLSTIIAFGLKALFDVWWAIKQDKKKQKVYADPLLTAAISLVRRFKEIYEGDAQFLSGKAPQNEYFKYMFLSTLYRLCAVLGWLRAADRELSGIEINDKKENTDLKKAVENFEQALSTSQFLSESRLVFLARRWKIDTEALDQTQMEHLGAEIEQLIWDALHEENANFAYELEEEKQDKLLEKVAYLMIESCGIEDFDISIIKETSRSTIRAISRVESWIYRDWQAAIGDMMLVESHDAERRFEVIGFNKFEDIYLKHLNEGEENNRWLERIVRLFRDLNLNRDDIFDARAQQLRNVCSATIELIMVLNKSDIGVGRIKDSDLKIIRDFDQKNNARFYEANGGKEPAAQHAQTEEEAEVPAS